ncbi:hypothetical protein [Arthrobacter sp. ok362]|jgi:hypothetical protein|uniref:hypothetical protein n=1 Tax=Arthrobacter sp. ok362 TaxID=1761745 RepID=UPI0008892B23|nr:hypothetical protein [Arthrobacter sp. ok362]SDL78478.1 hypothetical protein SAMN04487913_114117 [Arthrobacter sp. ok362]
MVIVILLAGLSVYAAAATVIAVLRDGRGHTPPVRSTRPWTAGDLPSEPYASPRSSLR